MSDIISRQAAIDALKRAESRTRAFGYHNVIDTIRDLPSVQPDQEIDWRKQGEWDMFELVTNVYFGKQYYFPEEDGIVYSRQSGKHMTREKAIQEFLDIIRE